MHFYSLVGSRKIGDKIFYGYHCEMCGHELCLEESFNNEDGFSFIAETNPKCIDDGSSVQKSIR